MSTTVDVRSIVPRERHPLIFSTFDGLKAGDTMELVNDHDPKPLFYQLQAERHGQFSWDYLEQGPETWRFAIEETRGSVQDAYALRCIPQLHGACRDALEYVREKVEIELNDNFSVNTEVDENAQSGVGIEWSLDY